MATIRNQRPSQKVWRLKRPPELNEKLRKWSMFSKCWSICLKKVVMFLKLTRTPSIKTQTHKHTNEKNKQASKQANDQTNKTSKRSNEQANKTDICNLQCRLFFFGPMQWLEPLRASS